MTAETATLPLPSDTRAREIVRSSVSIVVAPPVIVACLESIWVCASEVRPPMYWYSSLVTEPSASFVASMAVGRSPACIVESTHAEPLYLKYSPVAAEVIVTSVRSPVA